MATAMGAWSNAGATAGSAAAMPWLMSPTTTTSAVSQISRMTLLAQPSLGSVARVGFLGLSFAGLRRTYSTIPDEPHTRDVGRVVSSVTEKMGLGDNQFAAGGFQLALIGAVLAGIRLVGMHAVEHIKKQIIVTAEFDSRDESYSWILNWLSEHPYSQRATNFSVSTTIARGAQKINGLLWLHRDRVRPTGATVAMAGAPIENITISTLGRSREIIQTLIMEAQHKFVDRDKARTVIFAADQYGAWRRTKSRPKRPLDTIVMDPKLKNYIVDDAKEFFASESWYAERGLPFRRGLLLYGSPGTGKTSFIHALAGELGLNIYVINLSNKGLTDDTLSELVSDTPARCLLLVEDVDAAFVQRDAKDTSANITFSGLLNAIDGVAAQEGRILCMTTNHLDRLDDALIRPGRIDIRARFGRATKSQAKELFIKFYPHRPSAAQHTLSQPTTSLASTDSSEDEISGEGEKAGHLAAKKHQLPTAETASGTTAAEADSDRLTQAKMAATKELASKFAEAVPDQMFSIAQLQGFLMGYKKSPELAVQHVGRFVEKAVQSGKNGSAADLGADEWQAQGEEQEREKLEFQKEKERERRSSLA
ncbi:hypothetical protein DFQ27_004168 [Actinomortierella ambigua]|uniref:P-loop containing nucleoside triphosphate hydrolase protein n=1 Tax=Actinomortierella ambigua TaxID=1343610 RepID=A0A9P6U3S8_9FUNG|nr:hypothetical protein DFQ27_004168 [Actinomortierella ambigua]